LLARFGVKEHADQTRLSCHRPRSSRETFALDRPNGLVQQGIRHIIDLLRDVSRCNDFSTDVSPSRATLELPCAAPPLFFTTFTSNVCDFQILFAVVRKKISKQILLRNP
jgi:hypothetical protein